MWCVLAVAATAPISNTNVQRTILLSLRAVSLAKKYSAISGLCDIQSYFYIFINHCKSTWMFVSIEFAIQRTSERTKYGIAKHQPRPKNGIHAVNGRVTHQSHSHSLISHRAVATNDDEGALFAMTFHCYLTNWLTYGRKENRLNKFRCRFTSRVSWHFRQQTRSYTRHHRHNFDTWINRGGYPKQKNKMCQK